MTSLKPFEKSDNPMHYLIFRVLCAKIYNSTKPTSINIRRYKPLTHTHSRYRDSHISVEKSLQEHFLAAPFSETRSDSHDGTRSVEGDPVSPIYISQQL